MVEKIFKGIWDGGSAYPTKRVETLEADGKEVIVSYGGLSVRDAFAIGALQAMGTKPALNREWEGFDEAAVAAYCYADAMLKAREG